MACWTLILVFFVFISIDTVAFYHVYLYDNGIYHALVEQIREEKGAVFDNSTYLCSCIVVLLFRTSIKEYQLVRILGFLNPEDYEGGAGYIYLRLKSIISDAGWLGTTGTKEFIPSAHTDLVFASMIHNHGYLFAIILFLILSFFVVRMVVISFKVNDHFGKLLLVGGITLYGVQFIYNIGMVLGLLPITSMSLPFISYGLMPTLFNAFIIGSVLSVYRRKDLISSRFS